VSTIAAGLKSTVIGLGILHYEGLEFPEILQELRVEIIEREFCKKAHSAWSLPVTEENVCAGVPKRRLVSACKVKYDCIDQRA